MKEALRADAAWISTIHSMCDRILREHAVEIGLDPDFEMMDDIQAADLKQRAFSAVLGRLRRAGDSRFDAFFAEYGVGDSQNAATTMVTNLLEKAAMLPDGLDAVTLGPAETAKPSAVAREVLLAYEDLLAVDPTPKVKSVAEETIDKVSVYLLSTEDS